MTAIPEPATLFFGGIIWRGTDLPAAHSVLVVGGVLVAFDHEALEHPAAATAARRDLLGGFLMPGFGEGHSHPIFGGLESRGPQIRQCESVAEIVDEVGRYAAAHPEEDWILGASYNGSLVEGGLFEASWLDEAVSDRPVMLRAWDYHTVWCNSRALELAGITSDTPEPALGEIPRRTSGAPLGVLREWGAVDLMTAVSPGHSLDDRITALVRAQEHFASLGITWAQDAWVEPADVEVYLEAAKRGLLTVRMNLAFLADPRHFPASLPHILGAREQIRDLNHPLLSARTVKFFADGVIENETGALLEPYCTGQHHGMRVWEPLPLAAAVAAVEAEGFQPFIHAIGDAAVRTALDAIAHSRAVQPTQDTRPVITHVQLAEAGDLARFARLDVVANMQPLWAQLDDLMTVLTLPRLGQERSDEQYRVRTLAESGARVSFGSDWPCSSADPREGIAIATTRTTQDGAPAGGWIPQEIIDMSVALDLYTRGTAHQAFADQEEHPWGNLTEGAAADLVWLAADPRTEHPAHFPANTVLGTFVAGTQIFSQEDPR